jgi:hypothetical protein
MTTKEKISLIHLKVKALLMKVNSLENELQESALVQQNLVKRVEELTKTIEILEDKNKISKLADGIHLGKQDITEVKLTINRYVREIDECLKLLNQLPNNN